MAKKKIMGFEPIKEVLVESGKEILKKKGEKLLEEKKGMNLEALMERMETMRSDLKKNLMIYGLFGIGGFFILLGVVKYLPSILGMSEAKAFLLIGLALMLIGIIYRAGAKG